LVCGGGNEDFLNLNEGRIKEVSLDLGDDFAIAQVQVTQLLYFLAALEKEGVEATPSRFKEGEGSVELRLDDKVYRIKPNHPVESVSFHEAWGHAGRVGELTGLSYGVPSEKNWEFANRAGSKDKYHFGDDVTLLPQYAWFDRNSGSQTHAVGQLRPNGFNLYDTHGNVDEWTSSLYRGSNQTDRGGSWNNSSLYLRSAYRSFNHPSTRLDGLGFRLERQSIGSARSSYTFILGEPEGTPVP
jgi:formylglycine-generating enzyme required for sulfatase activity